MTIILTAVVIFFTMIRWLIFIDIILSWLALFGLKIRPQFLISIVEPLYIWVKAKIPTTIGPLDLTPIVILILMEIFTLFIYGIDPNVSRLMNNFFAIL